MDDAQEQAQLVSKICEATASNSFKDFPEDVCETCLYLAFEKETWGYAGGEPESSYCKLGCEPEDVTCICGKKGCVCEHYQEKGQP